MADLGLETRVSKFVGEGHTAAVGSQLRKQPSLYAPPEIFGN